jgi:hypothetical protein
MEYKTPKQSIWDLYEIGVWNVDARKKHSKIELSNFIVLMLDFLSNFHWININEMSLNSSLGVWKKSDSNISLKDWLFSVQSSRESNKNLEWEIGYAYFSYNLSFSGELCSFDKGGSFYFSFDPDSSNITFCITLNVDLFTRNPSRQPNVVLSDSELYYNNKLLTKSLNSIDNSINFKITSYSSDFHPDKIFKYGFRFEKKLITSFSIRDSENHTVPLKLTDPNQDSYFFEEDRDSYYKVSLSKNAGIKWMSENREIVIYEQNIYIWGLPSPDLEKVIVIYPMDHSAYPAPNNAAIHNADGSVYMQLSPPQLISDLAKQQQERDPKGPFKVHFEDVSWQYNNSGEVVVCISIAYNRDWHEDRELNTETGEFGECLNSGRR